MSTSSPLSYRELYDLSDPLAGRPLRLSDEHYSEWLTREQAWQLLRGQLKLREPLRLGAYRGGYPSDFLWAGLSHIVCVSQRLVGLLTDNEITGWAMYPVEIFGRKGESLPGYHGFSVIGPVIARDSRRSQIVDISSPVAGGRDYQVCRGLYFDESQWDGSDFFLVRRGIVVTERVYHIFKRNRVTNVLFTPLPEVEIEVKLDTYDSSGP